MTERAAEDHAGEGPPDEAEVPSELSPVEPHALLDPIAESRDAYGAPIVVEHDPEEFGDEGVLERGSNQLRRVSEGSELLAEGVREDLRDLPAAE